MAVICSRGLRSAVRVETTSRLTFWFELPLTALSETASVWPITSVDCELG